MCTSVLRLGRRPSRSRQVFFRRRHVLRKSGWYGGSPRARALRSLYREVLPGTCHLQSNYRRTSARVPTFHPTSLRPIRAPCSTCSFRCFQGISSWGCRGAWVLLPPRIQRVHLLAPSFCSSRGPRDDREFSWSRDFSIEATCKSRMLLFCSCVFPFFILYCGRWAAFSKVMGAMSVAFLFCLCFRGGREFSFLGVL